MQIESQLCDWLKCISLEGSAEHRVMLWKFLKYAGDCRWIGKSRPFVNVAETTEADSHESVQHHICSSSSCAVACIVLSVYHISYRRTYIERIFPQKQKWSSLGAILLYGRATDIEDRSMCGHSLDL